MRVAIRSFIIAVALLSFSSSSYSQEALAGQLLNRSLAVTLDLNEDGSYVETVDRAGAVQDSESLKRWKDFAMTYQPSVDRLFLENVHVTKPSGVQYSVAPRTTPVPVEKGMHKTSILRIAIPDLALGDIVSYKLSIHRNKGSLGSSFSVAYIFNSLPTSGLFSLKLRFPVSLKLYIDHEGLERHSDTMKDGYHVLEYILGRTVLGSSTGFRTTQFSAFPHLSISSFDDYAILGSKLAPLFDYIKNDMTVASIANGIASDTNSDLDVARAIYAWVKQNIAYDDRDMYEDGLTAHDPSVILERRHGDCKDHMVLLNALLKARGILAVPVLINSKKRFPLAAPAVIQAFDHVINYIPSLSVYLDATDKYAPFGILPLNEMDKPVLVLGRVPHVSATPATTTSDSNVTRTSLKFERDGRVHGTISAEYRGSFIPDVRRIAQKIKADDAAKFLKSSLLQNGLSSPEASLEFFDSDQIPAIRSLLSYSASGAIVSPNGEMRVESHIKGPFAISSFSQDATNVAASDGFMCGAKRIEEHFSLQFPAAVQVVGGPVSKAFEIGDIKYKATYSVVGGVLNVSRTLIDTAPHSVCSPGARANLHQAAEFIRRDLESVVRYRYN